MEGVTGILGVVMGGYVLLMLGVSAFAQRQVHDVEDFVVAGRRLGLGLSSATLLATWFGAGTLLTASNEVRARGVEAATLDPLGAGLCLILVGVFFAGPLWREKLTTLPELFGRRYGARAEVLGSLLMIPPYMGWIAAQFMALAGMLTLFFGLPTSAGVLLVALVGLGYTLLGGMWAVTLTDAAQLILVVLGLVLISAEALGHLGQGSTRVGWEALWAMTPAQHKVLVPTQDAPKFLAWLGVLSAGSLGNIPSQDVMQRVFSARSASVARWACLIAGTMYITLGAMPVMLGLAVALISPAQTEDPVLPVLASILLHPALAIVFVLMLMSAVLSTIDSAILAPATVLSRNLLKRLPVLSGVDELRLNRASVLTITVISVIVAFMGKSAYSLLESGYELGMVSLLAILIFGVYGKRHSEAGALLSMSAGTLVWFGHKLLGVETFFGVAGFVLPLGLCCSILALIGYPLGARAQRWWQERQQGA